MLISVESSQATYNHVVVVWRNMVIDFECRHTYALTEESLRQVCGVHTTFVRLTSGYGVILPKPICSAMKMPMNMIGVWTIFINQGDRLGSILFVSE